MEWDWHGRTKVRPEVNTRNQSTSNSAWRVAMDQVARCCDSNAGAIDSEDLDVLRTIPPPTFPPFKFVARRVRFDWRALAGFDVGRVVAQTDIDALEAVLGPLTWGDLEAEDTRHLGESGFVRAFRAAQLGLEYLLYVQDALLAAQRDATSGQARAATAARALAQRVAVLSGELRSAKRELRRSRATVRTLEVMATTLSSASGGSKAVAAVAAAAAAGASQLPPMPSVPATPCGGCGGCGATAVTNVGACMLHSTVKQPLCPEGWSTAVSGLSSHAELALHGQLSDLTARLTAVAAEAARLREDREELQYQIRHLHDTLAARAGDSAVASSHRHFSPARTALLASRGSSPRTWQRVSNGMPGGDGSSDNAVAVAVLDQLRQLHAEQMNAASTTHASELAELREQHASALALEAAACRAAQNDASVAALAQRKAAERSSAEISALQEDIQQLAADNADLRQRLLNSHPPSEHADNDLQTSLDASQTEIWRLQEELLRRDGSIALFEQTERQLRAQLDAVQRHLASPEAASPSFVARQRRETQAAELRAVTAAARIAQLEEALAVARAGGVGDGRNAVSQEPPSSPSTVDLVGAAEQLLAGSKIRAESDDIVVDGQGDGQGCSHASAEHPGTDGADGSGEHEPLPEENDWKLMEIARLQKENNLLREKAAALQHALTELERELAVAQQRGSAVSPAGSVGLAAGSWAEMGSVHSSGPRAELTAADLAGCGGNDGRAALEAEADSSRGDANNDETIGGAKSDKAANLHISASPGGQMAAAELAQDGVPPFRACSTEPQWPSSTELRAGGGSLPREAVDALRNRAAALHALPPEQLAALLGEAHDDWDKPFDLSAEEKAAFTALLPHEVPGRPGTRTPAPLTSQELVKVLPSALTALNVRLDGALASFGIHPGRPGLSDTEFLAATQLLDERRAAWMAALPPGQQEAAEVARLGLLLHCYSALQAALAAQPEGPDGRRHLPATLPSLLVSAVRPPPSMLPAGPPAVRVSQPITPRPGTVLPGSTASSPGPGGAGPMASGLAGLGLASRSASYSAAAAGLPLDGRAGSFSAAQRAAAALTAAATHSSAMLASSADHGGGGGSNSSNFTPMSTALLAKAQGQPPGPVPTPSPTPSSQAEPSLAHRHHATAPSSLMTASASSAAMRGPRHALAASLKSADDF